MKKFIAIIIVMSLGMSLVGCQKKLSYVETAAKYGYWNGFGGITWGMTIEECKSVLKLNENQYTQCKMADMGSENISEVEALSFESERYGVPIIVALLFNDFTPFDVGGEWLYAINVSATDSNKLKYGIVFADIGSELMNLELKYNKLIDEYSCPNTIENLQDEKLKQKAIKLVNEFYQHFPDENLRHEEIQRRLTISLDKIKLFVVKNPVPNPEDEITSVSFDGFGAALVALAAHNRPL